MVSADGGGGWIDCDIVNPETGVVQPKTSFIQPLDGKDFVGCGVYRQDAKKAGAVDAAAAAAERKATPVLRVRTA